MRFFSKRPKKLSPDEQKKLDERLVNAAGKGDTDIIQMLLANGADLHVWDDWALCLAACNGHTQTVEALLAAGANVHGWSDRALRYAARNGHMEVARVLLVQDADVHARNDDALCDAAYHGDTQMVQMLLAAGADVHARNDDALEYAAMKGHAETVRILLAHGANAQASYNLALRLAAGNGHAETVEMLQQAVKTHDAQRLELERQQNPLYAGTGLRFAESRPEDFDALLHEATQEQARMAERAFRAPEEYAPVPRDPGRVGGASCRTQDYFVGAI